MSAKTEQVAKDIEKFLNSVTERIIALDIRLLAIEQAQHGND